MGELLNILNIVDNRQGANIVRRRILSNLEPHA